MAKGFKKNIRFTERTEGHELRQSYLDKIAHKRTFLPSKIDYVDLDHSFIQFITNDCQIMDNDGKVIPVFFRTIQKWAEFTKTWEFTDEDRNIKLPFIVIIRRPDVQPGTNHSRLWNVPGERTYSYCQVPTMDGGREGYDLYKIPQPTCVDLTYDVKIFTNKLIDTNTFNQMIQDKFDSRQYYIYTNEHPIPLHLEAISDESRLEETEARKFYIQNYEFLSKAYILDEKKFEVVPQLNRTLMTYEVDNIVRPKVSSKKDGNLFIYTFFFKCSDSNTVSFTSTNSFKVVSIISKVNAENPVFKVNDVIQTIPFNITMSDTVSIEIERDIERKSSFKIVGE